MIRVSAYQGRCTDNIEENLATIREVIDQAAEIPFDVYRQLWDAARESMDERAAQSG